MLLSAPESRSSLRLSILLGLSLLCWRAQVVHAQGPSDGAEAPDAAALPDASELPDAAAPTEADAGLPPPASPAAAPIEAAPALEPQAAVGAAAATAVIASEAPDQSQELGTVIVTGVRGGQARTVADTPSPIDVISHEEIQATGRTGLKEILAAIVPAMSMPAQGGGGTSASVRPYTYRGLSGDYLLVLVNGKRRHTTSLINNLSRISGGSTPVDLDLIPASAISRIEILRDGAAAQYGSDAISGVLNIILDESAEGLSAATTAGQQYSKGGPMVQQLASVGLPLGRQGGFLRLSGDFRYHDRTKSSGSPLPEKRANGTPNYYYVPIAADQPDPREAGVEDKVIAGGYGRSNEDIIVNGGYNSELPLGRSARLYSFSTLSYRNIKDARGAFASNNIGALPERYPDGFQAYRRIWEWDGQAALGVKGDWSALKWDLSSSYGQDHVKLGAENTLNPSLGPTSNKSAFFMGKQQQDLWVNNLDLSRGFEVGLADKLQASAGLEHRWEKFQNIAGESDSYRDGQYIIPIQADPWHQKPLPMGIGGFGGTTPSPGLVSFTGTSPADERSVDRNNYAGYVELSTRLHKQLYVGGAGRAEHYTDGAGNVLVGKLVSRWDVVPGLAFRGGFNTGFRAPSLGQTAFSTTQNTGTIQGNARISTTSKFLPVDSEAAQALGASPLKPEKSLSGTAGITVEPTRIFRFTLDIYQTKIDDRIVKTDFLGTASNGGAAVGQLLRDKGINGVDSAQFFTNAIDTTTRGLDLVGELTLKSENAGTFKPSVGYSIADTRIDRVAENPPELAGLNVVLYGRQVQQDLVKGSPRSKVVLNGNWSIWRFKSDLRITRYDSYIESSNVESGDMHFSPKWITDLDVGFGITDNLSVAVGAYNLFDVYPDKVGLVSNEGSGQYGSFSPFGLSGGFYYARLGLNL